MSREMLTVLREQVRRIERPATTVHGVVSSGIAAIDRVLPGGGLARGAVHEILGMGGDEEDGALAAAFAAGILGRLGNVAAHPDRHSGAWALPASPKTKNTGSRHDLLSPVSMGSGPAPMGHPGMTEESGDRRPPSRSAVADDIVLWCLARPDLYGPGLAAHGLDPARLVLVRARRDDQILWAMEEGLRAPGLAVVVGEVGTLAAVASRRLQLAAERSGITAFLLRRWRDGGDAARERNLPNAAATRWRIAGLPSLPPPLFSSARRGPGIERPRWRVELLRCRGGAPACWEMEVADAAGSLSLADALADRPDAPIRSTPAEQLRGEKFQRAG
ncbi:MAG: ImuA family protein [Stellaceae bacterium]